MEREREFLGDDDDLLKHRVGSQGRPMAESLLREVLIDAEKKEAADQNIEHDWHRLRFALKKEKPRSRSAGYFAQAAVALLIVGSVYWMMPSDQIPSSQADIDEPVMRGKEAVELYSKNIPADAERMAMRFESLGLNVVRKIGKDKVELEVELMYPLSPAVVEVLRKEDIPEPAAGSLHLVFLPQVSL